ARRLPLGADRLGLARRLLPPLRAGGLHQQLRRRRLLVPQLPLSGRARPLAPAAGAGVLELAGGRGAPPAAAGPPSRRWAPEPPLGSRAATGLPGHRWAPGPPRVTPPRLGGYRLRSAQRARVTPSGWTAPASAQPSS